MIVFLARHTHADHAARQLGDRLRWYDCEPTVVWTSPAPRAARTAALILARLGWTGPVETVPDLAPGEPVGPVRERLRSLAPDAVVLLVGDEPAVGELGALLTERADFPALESAQVARLDDVALQRAEPPSPLILRWLFGYRDDAPVAA